MSLKDNIKNALDFMKEGVLNITKEMQSSEKVESIRVIKKNSTSIVQTITVNGKHMFSTDNCISINIEGDVKTVDTQGSVTCNNVTQNINTQGSVRCDDVGGYINTQGSVRCGDVHGSINTMGRVEANNVKGDIDTMGKVIINSRG